MNDHLAPQILEPIEKIARFIETGDETLLSAFASEGVVIIENFAPHLFEGADAVQNWSKVILSWHPFSRRWWMGIHFGARIG